MKPPKPFIVLKDFPYFAEILADPRFVLSHTSFFRVALHQNTLFSHIVTTSVALLDLLFRLAATFVRMINEAITHSYVKCCDLWHSQVNAVHG